VCPVSGAYRPPVSGGDMEKHSTTFFLDFLSPWWESLSLELEEDVVYSLEVVELSLL